MFGKVASSESVAKDFGLLLVRLGIGVSIFIFHGYDKITGGPGLWEGLGGFQADSFAVRVYRKEEPEAFDHNSTNQPKRKGKHQ